MQTFLNQVVSDLLLNEKDFSKISIIVPGNRPKAFLKKTFLEVGYRGILPEILSIEEFLKQISGLQLISGIPLWFKAFEVYNSFEDQRGLEDFLKWSPTLLKDFDDIDASLADSATLFNTLISEERIKKWGESLDLGMNEVLQNHIGFWVMAKRLYRGLQENLINEKLAYRGLLARKSVEGLPDFQSRNHKYFYFVGFNAFTVAEEKIVETLIFNNKAKCYWDSDSYYMDSNEQEAGKFLRKYKANEVFSPFQWVNKYFVDSKKIEVVCVPKQVGQAKYVGERLKKLSPEEREKTAIVLGDEQLLPAVLNSLPEEVKKLNITMGLPLKSVPLSQFFKSVFKLHYNKEKFKKENQFYYKDVLEVLFTPTFKQFFGDSAIKVQTQIVDENKVFVTYEDLKEHIKEVFLPLFKDYRTPLDFLNSLLGWIEAFQIQFKITELEREYLFRFHSIFQQLSDILSQNNFVDTFKLLQKLYNQILSSETITFLGEPLVGLQLLGVLETRLLDFKHIILTSVNEGVFPIGRQENTFIPFVYRKMLGLSTFLENDAIYAYHFYRLIQRCDSATLLYNTDSEGIGKGEPSRFLLQLEMESPHHIEKKIAMVEDAPFTKTELSIAKDALILEKLTAWSGAISPSSLSAYLWNPIDFYKRYVLKIREDREVEEIAGEQTIGTIVHDTLEHLYKAYLGEILTEAIFLKIEKDLECVFQEKFNDLLLKGKQPQGKNILIKNVSLEILKRTIARDKQSAKEGELIILALEKTYFAERVLNSGRKITFSGKIDRVDSYNGIIRVIDYKTGSFNDSDIRLNTKNIEKLSQDKKYAKAIQLLIYSYMYTQQNQIERVSAGIFPLRYFSKNVELLSIEKNQELNAEDIELGMQEIDNLIDEIFNEDIDFTQAEN